jgi:pilus assembly protein CpaC
MMCLCVLLPPASFSRQTASAQEAPLNELQRMAALDPIVMLTARRSTVEVVERLSKVIELKDRIKRVDGFDPNIIDVKALSPNRVRVQALVQGVTTLVLSDEFNNTYIVEIFVKGDARHLQAIINNRFPNSSVEAYKVQDAIELTGWVSQPEHITQIVEIAEQYYPRVLNHMDVGGVQQVKIKIKIMEVQRSKLRRMGVNFLTNNFDSSFISSTPGQLNALDGFGLSPGNVTASFTGSTLSAAALAFGYVTDAGALSLFLDALKEEEMLKILAEPTLVTTNGRPAMMLSGGEFPILVPQSLGTVSIEWRPFGVKMETVPRILGGGRVRLEVMPEVSERDFANSITLSGSTVPALITRSVNTQVEMQFGQTLMLAGLLSSRQTAQTQKIPFLGELPWAGTFFRRVSYEEVETELVILVTPELVAPLDADQVPAGGPGTYTTYPTDRELFFSGLIEIPKYGDECQGCMGMGMGMGMGTCGPNCTSSRRGQSFQLPIQEHTMPLTSPDGGPLSPVAPTGTREAATMSPEQEAAALFQLPRRDRSATNPFAGGVRQVDYQNSAASGQNRVYQALGRGSETFRNRATPIGTINPYATSLPAGSGPQINPGSRGQSRLSIPRQQNTTPGPALPGLIGPR